MLSGNRLYFCWVGPILAILLVGAAWTVRGGNLGAAEGQPAPSRKAAREESLKDLQERAKRLAAEGLPEKTPEETQKESKPIIPEDCVIEVATWHPADPKKQTFTGVFEIRGGVVTSKRPTTKFAPREEETFRSEGYESTPVFEGTLQGNVILGTWTEQTPWHQQWGWTNTTRKITSHYAIRETFTSKMRIELHRDGTLTATESGEHIQEINRIIGDPPGLQTIRRSWPDPKTAPEWCKPFQGVWQVRSPGALTAKPAEKPTEPTITTAEKFSLPKEKPLAQEPRSPGKIRSPSSGPEELQLDTLPPWAKRKFEALSPERKKLFTKYHHAYGLGWARTGKLLEWLSDEKLSMQELEVRARLLLATDQRYRQFYKTIVSKAVENVVEGTVWKQASRVTPVANYMDMMEDLASAPYELSVIVSEHQEAADADAMLDKFVKTWGKSEAEAVAQLQKTTDVIKFWNRRYREAEEKFKKAQALLPPATTNQLPSNPEEREAIRQALQDRSAAQQSMDSAARELKELDLEWKAWNLRVKTIRGDWKKWVVHWAK